MDTSEKLNSSLDDIAAGRGAGGRAPRVRGGRPPRGGTRGGAPADADDGFVPYRHTGGRTHLAGASLKEIAAASDAERCATCQLVARAFCRADAPSARTAAC